MTTLFRSLQATRSRRLLFPALLALGFCLAALLPARCSAQAAASKTANNPIEGTWQGTLHIPGHDLRTVLKITKSLAGALSGQFFTIDQTPQPFPISKISFSDGTLDYAITSLDLTYEGKLSSDGSTITGNTTQHGHSFPLSFARSTPATAWEMPTPPAPIKPMAADAHPSFEVATIKPSKPDTPGRLFRVDGRHFSTVNTSLVALINFAYGTQPKQIINLPPWADEDKYDIAGTPDLEGAPNDAQWKGMLATLLATRFQLKFHKDTRELPAYVLTVAKGGPKLEKSPGDPSGLPGLMFSGLGALSVRNATMTDFTNVMQQAVMDRPVVNHTDLPGRWSFNLKWTPDESQFSGLGLKVPPPTDAANAPPPLFTAIQEQLGLKLEAAKTAVPVLIIDQVNKPSAN